MIGGISEQCKVFDSYSQGFAYIKPLARFKWNLYPTQYVTLGNKIKIYSGKSLDADVYNVEKDEWSEEKGLVFNIEFESYFPFNVHFL